jgi:hypothetical protein
MMIEPPALRARHGHDGREQESSVLSTLHIFQDDNTGQKLCQGKSDSTPTADLTDTSFGGKLLVIRRDERIEG